MAIVSEIIAMCREGKVQEAYNLARQDFNADPTNVWNHRTVGWTLYYMVKNDTDTGDYHSLIAHLDELKSLDQLRLPDDQMIFENILFKVANFLRTHLPPTNFETFGKLSTLFSKLRDYHFIASKGYSFLLSCFIRFDNWQEMADFIDWWDLKNLTDEDYTPFVMDNGRSIMSLAERAFIAKSKALLWLNKKERIEAFLPQMDALIESHPEMLYPGYFYGKMLLALGSTVEEELRVILPFARKKMTEFWVWQLLSEVFIQDPEKQLACLFRAVNCKTDEKFLVKVRSKLAMLLIQRNMLDYAKFQIDKVVQTTLSQGFRLPNEVNEWIHQFWIDSVSPNDQSPIDYMSITNAFLLEGTEEAIAVVVYIDSALHRVLLVYGYKKRMSQKLKIKVEQGSILKINYITAPDGKQRVLNVIKSSLTEGVNYVKMIDGKVCKREDKDFAFLKTDESDIFIDPTFVKQFNLQNDMLIKCLVVFDYNKKKDDWNWKILKIIAPLAE